MQGALRCPRSAPFGPLRLGDPNLRHRPCKLRRWTCRYRRYNQQFDWLVEPMAKDCLSHRCSSLRTDSRLASYYDSCVWFTSRRPDTQGDCVGAAGILELFASSTSAVQISEGWIGATAINPQVSLFDPLVWPQRLFLILDNCRTQFSWVYICTLDSSFICAFQIQQRFALLPSSLLIDMNSS